MGLLTTHIKKIALPQQKNAEKFRARQTMKKRPSAERKQCFC